MKISEHGQTVIFDFSVAFFIFMIVFATLIFLFADSLTEKINQQDFHSMDLKANLAAETLVKSTGYPTNWQDISATQINSIGLCKTDRSIDEKKLNAFKNMDYDSARKLLGLNEFDFYFQFTGDNNVTAGLFPAADITTTTATRIVEYKGSDGIAKITVYRT